MAASKVKVGVVGCGAISGAYLSTPARFPIVDIAAVSDIDTAKAHVDGDLFAGVDLVIRDRRIGDLKDLPAELEVELEVNRGHTGALEGVGKRGLHERKHP